MTTTSSKIAAATSSGRQMSKVAPVPPVALGPFRSLRFGGIRADAWGTGATDALSWSRVKGRLIGALVRSGVGSNGIQPMAGK